MAEFVVVCGSVRDGREGMKVSEWVVSSLQRRGHEVFLLDPLEYEELLVMRERYGFLASPSEKLTLLRDRIVRADGFVAVTAEYNHSFPGSLKNVLDVFGKELFGSPFLLVSYSSGGFGGVRAVEQLRPILNKLGCSSIPESLAISRVQEVFGEQGVLVDETYTDRLAKVLDSLERYAEIMKNE
ncbi:MAG: NADPH-dependent FMN reductase [Candidatus Woesearchaeota archaeon]